MSAGRAVGWLVLGGLVSFVASETARLLIELGARTTVRAYRVAKANATP